MREDIVCYGRESMVVGVVSVWSSGLLVVGYSYDKWIVGSRIIVLEFWLVNSL